jgi:hypothetical protein
MGEGYSEKCPARCAESRLDGSYISNITMTAIPEPNVAALLGGLGAMLLLRRRRV